MREKNGPLLGKTRIRANGVWIQDCLVLLVCRLLRCYVVCCSGGALHYAGKDSNPLFSFRIKLFKMGNILVFVSKEYFSINSVYRSRCI